MFCEWWLVRMTRVCGYRLCAWSRNRRIITGGTSSLQINDRAARGAPPVGTHDFVTDFTPKLCRHLCFGVCAHTHSQTSLFLYASTIFISHYDIFCLRDVRTLYRWRGYADWRPIEPIQSTAIPRTAITVATCHLIFLPITHTQVVTPLFFQFPPGVLSPFAFFLSFRPSFFFYITRRHRAYPLFAAQSSLLIINLIDVIRCYSHYY